MSSRERMLCAISRGTPDYVPLSFMIFSALEQRCSGPWEFFLRQKGLGLDAVVELWHLNPDDVRGCADAPGPPVAFGPEVKVREWREVAPAGRYPLLHKEYQTPCGTLSCTVQQTDDWPHGDHVPFLDDYIEARATKPLITSFDDLEALRFLLRSPGADRLARTREAWAEGVRFILDVVSDWNRWREELMLDVGVDLLVRRAWYEGTDFWSPALYRRFFFPRLRAEVAMAHEGGAKFGYILTSGTTPLLEMIVEAGVDVLIGVDPVQGKGTVERGTTEDIRQAVGRALQTLGPDGFILSPVDNIRDTSPQVWERTMALIEAWKEMR